MFYIFSYFLINVIIYSGVNTQISRDLYEGDPCTFKSNNELGECTPILKCPSALAGLRQGKIPQNCGFDGTVPIVCCSKSTNFNATRLGFSETTTTRLLTTRKPTITTTSSTVVKIKTQESPNNSSGLKTRLSGQKSREKCVEYGKYVFSKRKSVVLLVDAQDIITNECGFLVEPLVVGGTKANNKEFPHQAAIGYEPEPPQIQWSCGASIISERFVLTAAHCIYTENWGTAKYVKVGITKLTDTNKMQIFQISEHFVHPDYKIGSPYNDIALLKLNKSISLNPFARPACLFTGSSVPTKNAIATGWGDTSFFGGQSDDLLKVVLELKKEGECDKHYKEARFDHGIDNNIQICVGASLEDKEQKDTCHGDSGGPLQIYHTDKDVDCMYDIIGITSTGKACGIGKVPAIYTRISHYVEWIEDIVWP